MATESNKGKGEATKRSTTATKWSTTGSIPLLHSCVATREILPSKRAGYTQKFKVGGQSVYLRTGEYEDGRLGEIFIDVHKTGTVVRALCNAVAIAVSRGLQYGIPLQEFVDSYKEFHFEPSGNVEGDPRISEAYSILGYIFTELELTYIKGELPRFVATVDEEYEGHEAVDDGCEQGEVGT